MKAVKTSKIDLLISNLTSKRNEIERRTSDSIEVEAVANE